MTVTPLQATWSLWLVIVIVNFEIRQIQVVVFLVILFCFLCRGTEEIWEKLWEQPKFQTTSQLQTVWRWVLDTLTSRNSLSSLQTAVFRLYCSCTAHWSLYVPHNGHYMYHQFSIQQFYVLPTQLYLCVLCGSEKKQRFFPYTTLTDWFV